MSETEQQRMINENTDLAEARNSLESEKLKLRPLEIAIETETLRRQETKLRELTAECRRAKDAWEELDGRVGLAQAAYRSAANKLREAEFELEQHLREKPLDSNFPSDQEVGAWRAELAEKRSAVDDSMEQSARTYKNVENLQNQRRMDHAALSNLTDQRNRLAGSLPAMQTTLEKLRPSDVFKYEADSKITVVLDSIATVTR